MYLFENVFEVMWWYFIFVEGIECIFGDDFKLRVWNVLGGVGGVVCVVLNECLECWVIMLL